MQWVMEQMVRHIVNYEATDLAKAFDDDLAGHGSVTARGLFIDVVGWVRGRVRLGRAYPLRLPDRPWATELKCAVLRRPELAAVFQLTGDRLDYRPDLDADDVAQAEAYVAEHYNPILRR